MALVADGLHAAVDVASDIIALGSLYLASQSRAARRCKFPFGKGRAEAVGAVMIAVMLLSGAVGVAYTALDKLYDQWVDGNDPEHDGHHHEDHHHDHSHGGVGGLLHAHDHSVEILRDGEGTTWDRLIWSMVFVAASSVFVKEALYHVMRRAGEKVGSVSVVANAYHHRADGASAAVGLFGVVSTAYGFPMMDNLAGLGVSIVIMQVATRTLRNSVLQFFDYQSGDLQEIRHLARGATSQGTAVNVFATRHGMQYVLHGTLLMKTDATCRDVAELEHVIQQKVRNVRPHDLFDVFFKVRPIAVAGTEAQPYALCGTDFMQALREVTEFHGMDFDKFLTVNLDKKEVKVLLPANELDEDCVFDLRNCAMVYGIALIETLEGPEGHPSHGMECKHIDEQPGLDVTQKHV